MVCETPLAQVLDKIMWKSITLMNNHWVEWLTVDHGWNTILKCFLASLLSVLYISEVLDLEFRDYHRRGDRKTEEQEVVENCQEAVFSKHDRAVSHMNSLRTTHTALSQQNFSMDYGGVHEVLHLDEDLLATDDCWRKESISFLQGCHLSCRSSRRWSYICVYDGHAEWIQEP